MKKTLLTLSLMMATTSVAVYANMDHSNMDHGQIKMNHGKMEHHGDMDHSNMDMSSMKMGDMKGMSDVGMPAKGAKPNKVIQVILADDMTIKFKGNAEIKPDDVVQFVVMNTGKIDHEFTIGSHDEQVKHREMMRNMSGSHKHDMGNAVTVSPGKAKQLTWHFHGDNNVEFACNIPGHAEAGMVKEQTL